MESLWIENKHSLDITPLDNQHKELFSTTEALYKLAHSNGSKTDVLKLLKRLNAYTNYHFSSEEGLFLKFEYPDAKKHKLLHKAFSEKIKQNFEALKDNKNINLQNLLDLLSNWITNHILNEDRKYADFFKKNGINISDNFFFSTGEDIEEASKEIEEAADNLWNDRNLSLRIKEIDSQHRELVLILQQVNDMNRRGVSEVRKKMFLPVIIKKLYYYSQFHFNLEESLMEKHNYPQLSEHKEIHKTFIKQISKFAKDYHKGKSDLSEDILEYLKEWTMNHIIRDDGKYRKFIYPSAPEK